MKFSFWTPYAAILLVLKFQMEKKPIEEEIGKEVKENNEKIVRYLLELRAQRDELMFLIQKQAEEKAKFEMEMERLTYKLCLVRTF